LTQNYLHLCVFVVQLRPHKQGDVVLRLALKHRVGDSDQLRIRNRQPGLLEHLARGAVHNLLAIVEMAAGELPRAGAVRALALAEEELTAGVVENDANADADVGEGGHGD